MASCACVTHMFFENVCSYNGLTLVTHHGSHSTLGFYVIEPIPECNFCEITIFRVLCIQASKRQFADLCRQVLVFFDNFVFFFLFFLFLLDSNTDAMWTIHRKT